ncbi:MAG: hypothetical protein WC261_11795, partial [Synergistaceae bacterium]
WDGWDLVSLQDLEQSARSRESVEVGMVGTSHPCRDLEQSARSRESVEVGMVGTSHPCRDLEQCIL